MTKEQTFKELEKIVDAISEEITKLKNDETTIEEANAFTMKWVERLAKIEEDLEELINRK